MFQLYKEHKCNSQIFIIFVDYLVIEVPFKIAAFHNFVKDMIFLALPCLVTLASN